MLPFALATLALVNVLGGNALAAPLQAERGSLTPTLFAELSSGISLVRTYTCSGTPVAEGTGFLVGSSVVMTARHVVKGACRVKVEMGGHWINTGRITSWYTAGAGDVNVADVATIKLAEPAKGHVFTIRSWSAAVGTNLSALGHPLGNNISLNQGKVVQKGKLGGVPMLAVRILAAEGGSGSPLVDNKGNVVSILQIGLGGKDIAGQRTSGVILGIDLPSWWPGARKNLCKAYPNGGILGCPGTPKPKPTPPPTPMPTPTPIPAPAPTPDGTRANPWPVGHAIANSTWSIEVDTVNFDAWSLIQAANQLNTAPPDGYVDVMATLSIGYLGAGSADPSTELDPSFGVVGSANVEYRSYEQECGVLPGTNDFQLPTLFTGGSATYNQCWQVPAAEAPSLEFVYDKASNGFFALH